MAAALAAGCSLVSVAPVSAAARNYDCSKAGNANKAACKTGAKDAAKMTTKPAAAAKAAKPVPAKAAPKTAAAAKPAAASPGILQRMSNALHGSSTPTPAAAAKAPKPRKAASAAPAAADDRNAAGAIAQCKDGLYSHAKGRSGACSRHGGVAKWM
jgi:hypothetical protein